MVKAVEHVPGQLIFPGLLVTVPDPVSETVSVLVPTYVNVAVALSAALIVTVHVVAVPVQAPLQLLNALPVAAGAAVNVGDVP